MIGGDRDGIAGEGRGGMGREGMGWEGRLRAAGEDSSALEASE